MPTWGDVAALWGEDMLWDGTGSSVATPTELGCRLADLRQSVRTVAKDFLGAYISDADIDVWINEAQRDLATRLRILQEETTGTVLSGSLIPLPGDLLNSHWVELDNETVEVEFVNDAVFMSWLNQRADPNVVLGRIFAGNIELYPDATGRTYVLRYEFDPPTLVVDDDRSPLPKHLCPKMVNYGRAYLSYKDGDPAMGDRYMGLYEQGLPPVVLGRSKLAPGPMTISFQRGPFDTRDSRH